MPLSLRAAQGTTEASRLESVCEKNSKNILCRLPENKINRLLHTRQSAQFLRHSWQSWNKALSSMEQTAISNREVHSFSHSSLQRFLLQIDLLQNFSCDVNRSFYLSPEFQKDIFIFQNKALWDNTSRGASGNKQAIVFKGTQTCGSEVCHEDGEKRDQKNVGWRKVGREPSEKG